MSSRRAFTLVELLVVIGVIALLISILLPSLSKARESANRLKCASNLRQVGMACVMHANDHRGFYPLAGRIRSESSGFLSSATGTPANVFDIAQRKYTYLAVDASNPSMIAPLPVAIAPYLGVKIRTDNAINTVADLAKPNGISKYFYCPSDVLSDRNIGTFYLAESNGYSLQCTILTSYQLNEAFLGTNDMNYNAYRLYGNSAKVHHADQTVLFIDGIPRPGTTIANYSAFYNLNTGTTLSASLYDIMAGVPAQTNTSAALGGYSTSFDPIRHHNRMNILFIDGHVENVQMYQSPTSPTPASGNKQIWVYQPS